MQASKLILILGAMALAMSLSAGLTAGATKG